MHELCNATRSGKDIQRLATRLRGGASMRGLQVQLPRQGGGGLFSKVNHFGKKPFTHSTKGLGLLLSAWVGRDYHPLGRCLLDKTAGKPCIPCVTILIGPDGPFLHKEQQCALIIQLSLENCTITEFAEHCKNDFLGDGGMFLQSSTIEPFAATLGILAIVSNAGPLGAN